MRQEKWVMWLLRDPRPPMMKFSWILSINRRCWKCEILPCPSYEGHLRMCDQVWCWEDVVPWVRNGFSPQQYNTGLDLFPHLSSRTNPSSLVKCALQSNSSSMPWMTLFYFLPFLLAPPSEVNFICMYTSDSAEDFYLFLRIVSSLK